MQLIMLYICEQELFIIYATQWDAKDIKKYNATVVVDERHNIEMFIFPYHVCPSLTQYLFSCLFSGKLIVIRCV
jgi:hypothetical protein